MLVHIFWACSFAEQCWNFVCPRRNRRLSVLEAFEDVRTKIKLPFAMKIMILAAWGIWIVRNNIVFNDHNADFNSWKAIYEQELRMLVHRIKKKHICRYL
jgi:hypothetical protein